MIKSTGVLRRSFSMWKPNVPKHKVVIDKQSYRLPHPVWCLKSAETVDITHHQPAEVKDKIAFNSMKYLRKTFDFFSGYRPGKMHENLYLRRFIFLETCAAVPGMIGGMIRHMKSLRTMSHDGGWIHHLLEEAENERMHLFTFIQLRNPGIMFRLAVLLSQAVFILGFTSAYAISPRTAHRFVGYLEEEAVKTYTNCIKDLDEGKLPLWINLKAPEQAVKYWGLPEDSSFRDVLVAVRADEVMHREVNHHLADLRPDMPVDGHKYHVVENIVGEATKDDAPKAK
jgi:demethoxyubiquinone hydroxylase (CLK1/Coq7/Cat5 family)